jgi:hypothetical protein
MDHCLLAGSALGHSCQVVRGEIGGRMYNFGATLSLSLFKAPSGCIGGSLAKSFRGEGSRHARHVQRLVIFPRRTWAIALIPHILSHCCVARRLLTASIFEYSLEFLPTMWDHDGVTRRHMLFSWCDEPCPFGGVKRLSSSRELETPAGVVLGYR